MMKQHHELNQRRRSILAFYYTHFLEHSAWPTLDMATKQLGGSRSSVYYNIKILVDKDWMVIEGKHIRLSDTGIIKLDRAERVASGELEKEPQNMQQIMFKNIVRKRYSK